MNINNENKLQTHQGMDSSQLFWQKSIGRTLYSV